MSESEENSVFSIDINPRFCDTDAMGHINNTVYPVWFLEGRESILRIFTPSLSTDEVSLVLAKLEIEYLGEVFFGKTVEVKTYVLRIGVSSVLVGQEAWQDGNLKATATATMVNFDKRTRKSLPIPNEIKQALSKHLLESES
ncbi:MAG: acyl-CoA thioesterase [Pseudomonadales bacterium]|nr:acyl-CoA thioesterase [Pseudomonadales bacterium]